MKVSKRFIVVLFINVLLGFAAYSQNLINIKHYSTADGLSDNKITNIIKDRDGFIWFASWAGLNRFDGHNFLNYKSYPGDQSSLRSNRIDEIVEDKQAGYLWLKAYDNQVYRFNKHKGTFTALSELLNDERLKKVLCTKILAVVNSEVWIQTAAEGIILIQDALGQYPSYTVYNTQTSPAHQIASNKITFFHIDKFKKIWLGTSKGVSVLIKNNKCDYIVKSGLKTESTQAIMIFLLQNLLYI